MCNIKFGYLFFACVLFIVACQKADDNGPLGAFWKLLDTLFDENAACHLAVGMGFADTIEGHHEKTLEECRALGINDSMIHEDFMIGCDSMNIDGICEDGSTVAIVRNGNWAF